MKWGSSRLIKHCHCVLVWKLNWIFHGELQWILLFYCLNINVNISSFSPLINNVNTTLKYFHKQALNKKLKLMGRAMKYFTKKFWAMDYLALWSPGLRNNFWKNYGWKRFGNMPEEDKQKLRKYKKSYYKAMNIL